LLRFQTRSDGRPLLRFACQRVSHALCQREHDADRWIAATALRLDVRSVSNDLIFETTPGLGLEAVRV
jgi:predicted nucleic acid-binding protein